MAESVSHFFQPKTKRFGEVDGFAKSEPGRPTLLDPMVAPPLINIIYSIVSCGQMLVHGKFNHWKGWKKV
jgi:hypothetical protein